MRQYSYSQVHNVVLLCLMHWAMALKWRSFFCVVESSFSPGGGWNLNLWLHLKRSAFFPVFLHWCDWDSYYLPKTYGHCHPASPTVGKSDLSCRKTTRLMSCQCFHIQLTCELGGEPVYCQKTIPTLTRMHSQVIKDLHYFISPHWQQLRHSDPPWTLTIPSSKLQAKNMCVKSPDSNKQTWRMPCHHSSTCMISV